MAWRNSLILCLPLLLLATACSGPPIVEDGEPVVIELAIQTLGDPSVNLSPEACRQSIESNLAQRRGWRVVREETIGNSQAAPKQVRVVLNNAVVELVSKEGAGKRLASWFFLGPAHFWLRDHTFRLTCEPSYTVFDSAGKTLSPKRSLAAINSTRRLNFHEWSGKVSWYILSNFVPPFLSEPDSEELTLSLFDGPAQNLVSNIEDTLNGKGPTPKDYDFEVTEINRAAGSPVKVIGPKLGDKIEGSVLEVELAVIDSSSLVSVRLGHRTVKAPFPRTIKAPLKINGGQSSFEVRKKGAGVERVSIVFKSLGKVSVPAPVEAVIEEALEVRRVVPELSSPIRVIKPKEGDPIQDGKIEVEIEIVAPKLISAIKIGRQSWSSPFTRTVLKGWVDVVDGRGSLSIVGIDDDLSRVRILCRKRMKQVTDEN
ncbi:MAG: hypothetical protein P1V97_25605 [Planctomycetota bacterium]|nr:hypothetical protein [Planctomycetota bacterium]